MDPSELARRVGVKPAAVYQWESGATKSLKAETALALAGVLGVDIGWLVTGKAAKVAPLGESQSMRPDAHIVRNVATALNLRYEKAGGYNLAERPDEFVTAYGLWVGMPDAYDSPEVFNLVVRYADLSPQGITDDRGSEGAPPFGAPGKGTGTG
jgi:transcriptional regulator with XRE-family HTH domain